MRAGFWRVDDPQRSSTLSDGEDCGHYQSIGPSNNHNGIMSVVMRWARWCNARVLALVPVKHTERGSFLGNLRLCWYQHAAAAPPTSSQERLRQQQLAVDPTRWQLATACWQAAGVQAGSAPSVVVLYPCCSGERFRLWRFNQVVSDTLPLPPASGRQTGCLTAVCPDCASAAYPKNAALSALPHCCDSSTTRQHAWRDATAASLPGHGKDLPRTTQLQHGSYS